MFKLYRQFRSYCLPLACCAICLVVMGAAAFSSSAATGNNDEQLVRQTYATVSFLCGLPPLTKAAYAQMDNKPVNQATLETDIQNAKPVFELSNFSSGTVASIADRKYSDFVTYPEGDVLKIKSSEKSFTDSGNPSRWQELSVMWAKDQNVESLRNDPTLNLTIGDMLTRTQGERGAPQTVTRYVAYTVDITYQGKTTGAYRSMFLFGIDDKGKSAIWARDLVAETPLNHVLFVKDVYPSGLLKSRLRDTPVVSAWIAANSRQSQDSCSPGSQLCCVDNKCGLPEASVRRDLAIPLPEAQSKQ